MSAVNMLYATVGVADDHDFFHAELNDGDKKAADHASERVGDNASGVLDDLSVAVLNAESGGKQLDQAGVHAGEDCQLFAGIFIGSVLLVFFLFHEFFVVFQNVLEAKKISSFMVVAL